jgi:hypothetical protein
MAEKGWRRQFDDPIALPNGRKLVTLEDAGNYITKLPKAEHAEWRAAMAALILVAEKDGPEGEIALACAPPLGEGPILEQGVPYTEH